MAVEAGTSVAGYVLDHWQYAAFDQALARPTGEVRHAIGIAAISTVADHRISPGDRKVEHREAIDRDPQLLQVVGD